MKFLIPIMEKIGVIGDYPKGTNVMGPDNKDKVQPTGDLANPYLHNTQKVSDMGQNKKFYFPTSNPPKGETNMRGEGNQLAAIPGGIVGGKVGPRPLSDSNRKYLPKFEKKSSALQYGFLDEFNKIKGS